MHRMRTIRLSRTTLAAIAALGVAACAAQPPRADAPPGAPVTVGGAEMHAGRDIVEHLSASRDHDTLIAAIRTAGLRAMLKEPGPYTLFAATDAAFDKLPEGTVPRLLAPGHRARLNRIVEYHVVSGRYIRQDLVNLIAKGGGEARLPTIQGEELVFTRNGPGNIVIRDARNASVNITIYDACQRNGVVHVTNGVLFPV